MTTLIVELVFASLYKYSKEVRAELTCWDSETLQIQELIRFTRIRNKQVVS